jgi:hypothetical protein
MPSIQQKYFLEKDLVDDFCICIESESSPWGKLVASREFSYGRGRVDIVAVNDGGKVIAFEAKLYKWRDALQQAYRNKCLAHKSYVVLPEDSIPNAIRYSHEFKRRFVGLCCVSSEKITIVLDVEAQKPIQHWLFEKAYDSVN